MRHLPKSFTLGGHTFTVKLISTAEMAKRIKEYYGEYDEDDSAYGLFIPDEETIYLLKPSRKLKLSVIFGAFWHEYAHAQLWVMGDDRWMDEEYVQNMGRLLHQAHNTFTF